jgi:hypothetical protein
MPAVRNSLKDALHAAIDKYAEEEGTDFDCAFRDALADMRHIAGDHMLDYHLEDVRAEGLYKEERDLVGAIVICSICGKVLLEAMAHLHQNKWIGDRCCWDERLRNTE